MELFANVKNAKGEIVEITSNDFTTKKDFKSYLHDMGFKVRFIAKDTVTDITQAYEKYEEKKATAKVMKKTNREFKVNNTTYSVVDNENYNKEFAFENSCMKYYAIRLTTDNTSKSWVKTTITGNTIAEVKEKVKGYEDFVEHIEKPEPVGEPVGEPVPNAEPTENEIMNISAYKLNNIYDLIEHLEHFLTKRELVTTISNKFNISNELAVELYNKYIRSMYLDGIE